MYSHFFIYFTSRSSKKPFRNESFKQYGGFNGRTLKKWCPNLEKIIPITRALYEDYYEVVEFFPHSEVTFVCRVHQSAIDIRNIPIRDNADLVMAPAIYHDDDVATTDNKELFFEASILHRIPTELLIESASTPYLQSLRTGEIYCGQMSRRRRRKRKAECLRKLAKMHAQLLGKLLKNDSLSSNTTNDSSSNNAESRLLIDNVIDSNNNSWKNEARNLLIDRNELLLDITLRTMVLVHHNQQLQNRLTALQIETRNLVSSCLHNRDSDKGGTSSD